MMTVSPGRSAGTRTWRTYSTKMLPFMAQSMAKGAMTPSVRRARIAVIVFQCPKGTRQTNRLPHLERPQSRAILVEVPVSSRKMSFPGSRRGWLAIHSSRARATSGRCCSAACTVFFEADAFGLEEAPHRSVADLVTASRQLFADLLEREVRHRLDPMQQPHPLTLQPGVAIATHRLGRHTAGLALARDPIDHRRDAKPEQMGHLPTRQSAVHRRNRSLT